MEATDRLAEHAREMSRRAYAPYSGFHVGAALESEDGTVFGGCNVENGSYGLTLCAERVAVGAAVAAGHRRFRRLALHSDGERPVPPCGACRQVLAEFGLDLAVTSEAGSGRATWTLGQLLPDPFIFEEGKERGG